MSQKTFLTEEPATRAAWTLTGFQVNLYAEDVEPAIAFYAALGFEESYRYLAAGTPQHVEVRNGGLTIGVSSVDAARAEHGFEASQDGASVEIVLWCNDSDAAYAQALAAGATVLREPHDFQNGRLHVARVFDPLGNPLVLVQKRDTRS
jgi:lactoylglutathione lyase